MAKVTFLVILRSEVWPARLSLVLVLRFAVRTLLPDQYSTSGSICSGKIDSGESVFLPEQIFRDSSIIQSRLPLSGIEGKIHD